jgi:uncharacterized membrane protein YkoI
MRIRRLAATIAAAALVAGTALADDRHDQDRALEALRRGEVAPLEEILDLVRRTRPGTVLEVELEREGGRWVYEVETLNPEGVIGKVRIDATTRALLPDGRGGRRRGKED